MVVLLITVNLIVLVSPAFSVNLSYSTILESTSNVAEVKLTIFPVSILAVKIAYV